ncbi:fibronectin type III domain-containing protein [Cesiribacter andamanensis]|uniref:Fibronectin type-III domain-containing protein n=1 Tax=Cesiribacter andamanensis AMV16 TaxID=1279009 RepID=M7N7Q8_9BACT|nr:fibronectin type III domain-containing protein [Cesiribacter andamanensis]EMR04648.1 hypothetical protein ADICEAN_00251 [Cesiribacter andamanensis AMV16]
MSVGSDSNYKLRAKAGSTATAYTVTQLSEGQTYYFKVRAKNSKGYSDYSNEIVFKMVAGAVASSTGSDSNTEETSSSGSTSSGSYSIAAPSHLGGTADKTTAIKLNWKDNANNESEHEIYMSIGSDSNYKLRAKAGTNSTAYTVTQLSEGQTYYFKVRAKNSQGYSDFSNEIVFKMASGAVATTTNPGATSSANMGESDGGNFYSGANNSEEDDLTLTVAGQQEAEEAVDLPEGYSAYPNPARDHISLRYENVEAYSDLQIRILDFSGTVRMTLTETTTGTSGDIRLNLDAYQLPSGYYIIQIITEKGENTIKFLKN